MKKYIKICRTWSGWVLVDELGVEYRVGFNDYVLNYVVKSF